MNTRHSRTISRRAAESLLDGQAGPDHDQLAQVLAAAAAPAHDDELAGEQLAVAAFEARHLLPVATPQKEHKSMLAKILTAKILVTSLAAFATGGVALAASTGALTGSSHVHVNASQPGTIPTQAGDPLSTPTGVPTVQPTAMTSSPGTVGTAPQPADSPSAAATGQSLPKTAAGLCQALIGDVAGVSGGTISQSGQLQALSSTNLPAVAKKPEFASLVSTAQSVSTVGDYCSLLLDLPGLPDPSALAQLPGTLLGQLLTALPTATLAQDLTSLPTSTLSQVLTSLPTSALSAILNQLPTSVVSQLLQELPASVLSQLPASVLAQLPSSVLSGLPLGL